MFRLGLPGRWEARRRFTVTWVGRLLGGPAVRVTPTCGLAVAGGRGEPVGPHYSTRGGWVVRAGWARAAAVATLLAALPLVVSGARSAAAEAASGAADLQLAPVGDPARELAGLEAQAARLARQYRGEVVQLTDADRAAKVAVARVVRLRRELGRAHRDVARLAAAGYMAGVQDPAVAMLGNGNPQRVLEDSAA